MRGLSDQRIRETLLPYVPSPDAGQCNAIRAYVSLLLRWNQTISLTTVVDPLEILRFHFGESLFALHSVPIEKGRLADVGSGAGFPGIPVSIAIPSLPVILIESNTKKAAFLAEVVRQLDLTNVEVLRLRMDEVPTDMAKFDFVTARALGGYPNLLSWSRERLTKAGRIILWLGEEEARAIFAVGQWTWRVPILIPGSKRRFILIGSFNE